MKSEEIYEGLFEVVKDVENLTLTPLRDIGREQADHRDVLIGLVDQVRRLENLVDTRVLGVEQRIANLRASLIIDDGAVTALNAP